MKKRIFFAFLLIVLVFASCKKENIQPQSMDENVVFLNIGAWNMSIDTLKSIEHGLNYEKIKSIDVLILSDFNIYFPIYSAGNFAVTNEKIMMRIETGSDFNSVYFSNSTINRGIITIHYNID